MKAVVFLLAIGLATAAFAPSSSQAATDADAAIADVAHDWARASYATPDDGKVAAYESALAAAERTVQAFPARAEPKVWEAIVLASLAHAQGGLDALGKAKRSRDLLLEAEKIDANAMDGSIYATLGSLYGKVPGWPIGFGDKKKAREYLDKAIAIDPSSIDSNYFYADFLVDQGDYASAAQFLKRALDAPPRPGRDDADAGRRGEVEQMLSMLREKHAAALASR
ncbi:MAG TPA: tetratricopeptide repeat protein [Rhodanobacteraceae bacterium]